MKMADPAVHRFARLLLWQAAQDRATDLVIGVPASGQSGTPIRFKVRGSWFDVSPPPSWLHPLLVAELGRVAGFGQDNSYPKEGIVDFATFTGPLKWSLRIAQPGGECALRPL